MTRYIDKMKTINGVECRYHAVAGIVERASGFEVGVHSWGLLEDLIAERRPSAVQAAVVMAVDPDAPELPLIAAGGLLDGGILVVSAPEEVVTPVPQVVTKRQARQALLLAGRLADVQPAIDAIPDPLQRGLVQIEWDDSQEFQRTRPSLIALASAIGLTSQDLDQLFILAAAR